MNEQQTLMYIKNMLRVEEVCSEVLTITPKIAEYLISNNWPENRKLSETTYKKYAVDIKNGNWKLNGEAVIFTKTSKLVDGQHRLWAVIEAEAPFTTLVTFGVEEDAFSTIDSGYTRSISFRAKQSPAMSAALNMILMMGYGRSFNTTQNMITIEKVYGESIRSVLSLQTRNTPIMRQAAIVTAATLWYHAGQQAYVSRMYSNLITMDTSELPPIGKAFFTQCMSSAASTKKIVPSEMFARAFRVFTPKASQLSKVQVKDSTGAQEIAQKMILDAVKTAGVAFSTDGVVRSIKKAKRAAA